MGGICLCPGHRAQSGPEAEAEGGAARLGGFLRGSWFGWGGAPPGPLKLTFPGQSVEEYTKVEQYESGACEWRVCKNEHEHNGSEC